MWKQMGKCPISAKFMAKKIRKAWLIYFPIIWNQCENKRQSLLNWSNSNKNIYTRNN